MNTEKSIIITAVSFGLLLLITPPPPQIAIFAFVAIMLLGFTFVLGYRNILYQIESTRSRDGSENDPKDNQENEFENELERVHEQYTKKNGINEAQLERELEQLHEEHLDEKDAERIDQELEQLTDQRKNDIDSETIDEKINRLEQDQ